jgi:hypothetical protein
MKAYLRNAVNEYSKRGRQQQNADNIQELLTTHEPISDKSISEIVDEIFMPLVHHTNHKSVFL